MDDLLARAIRALAAQHLIAAETQIAIVDATVVEAAQSGFKTRDPEGGSSVKRGPKGKVAGLGLERIAGVDEDNFARKWILPPKMPPKSSIWSTSCWAMRNGFTPI
jgi:IS5 family transposase